MSQYVAMQWKSVGVESQSKRPRLDVLEARPEKISPRLQWKPFIETNKDNQLATMSRVTAEVASAAGATASEAGVTEFVSSGDPELVVPNPETAAEQAQKQMHEFVSTVTELCAGFTTSKKQIEELTRQVTDLESQIQEWKDQKSSWDEKKKVLESDRDAARQEARGAIFEKCDLKEKLEKAAKEAEDVKASNKKFDSTVRELVTALAKSQEQNAVLKNQASNLEIQIRKWKDQKAIWVEKKQVLIRDCNEGWREASRAISEMRYLEDKLEKASKEAEDAKASAKKARSEAVKQAEYAEKTVASTKKSYKIALGNFVEYLANDEGKFFGDYVNELVKEMTPDNRAPADGAVDVAGHEGDKVIKDEAL